MSSETKLSPTYEYSPEHAASSFSEGESLIHSNNQPQFISPPFIKIPLEDRSKYEKLTGSQEDVSSDESSGKENENHRTEKVKKRRNIKHIPEKLHSAYNKVEIPRVRNLISREKHSKDKNDTDKNIGYDSDDSIGSASDLRDDDIEKQEKNKKTDEISETISESIHTCGSSVYHAECESMATKEDDCASRMLRMKKLEQPPVSLSEDMLFVGHQYGEKPLLLDDELDSDCELKLENSTWSVEKKKPPQEIWTITKSCDADENDVFASAPFPKISKKKKSEEVIPLQEELSIVLEETPKVSRNQSPLLILSPSPENDNNYVFNQVNLNPFMDQTSTPKVVQSSSNYGIVTVNSNVVNIEIPSSSRKNLFETEMKFDAFSPFSQEDNFSSLYFSPQTTPVIYENVTIPVQTDACQEFAFKSDDFTDVNNFKLTPFDTQKKEDIVFEPESVFFNNEENAYYKQEQDGKKDKKGKSKYQLIDTEFSDELSSKAKSKSLGYKKVGSKSKRLSNKLPKMPVGFSNMSFEDFPSDESEQVNNFSTPFEVVRKSYEEEKKYGSLKRRSNPFS